MTQPCESYYYDPPLTDKETKAQRGEVTTHSHMMWIYLANIMDQIHLPTLTNWEIWGTM